VDIVRLNFKILALIPKMPGAEDIHKFRPIVLINVVIKFRPGARIFANFGWGDTFDLPLFLTLPNLCSALGAILF
jgi:hypothetical protein